VNTRGEKLPLNRYSMGYSVRQMDKKYVAVICAVLLAFGAIIMMPPALANGDTGDLDIATGMKGHWRPLYRWKVLRYIIKNGEPFSLTGDAVSLSRHILVLDIGEIENVNLPGKWVVNGIVVNLPELYDEYLSGNTITVDTLKLELVQETKTVTVYFGYKITIGDVVAESVLPFNINVN